MIRIKIFVIVHKSMHVVIQDKSMHSFLVSCALHALVLHIDSGINLIKKNLRCTCFDFPVYHVILFATHKSLKIIVLNICIMEEHVGIMSF